MKKKKEYYIGAKKIVEENAEYILDNGKVSLPWNINRKIHLANTSFKKLDYRVRMFCHRANRDEILILDAFGRVLRYYSLVDAIQKTPLEFTEEIYALESIGDTLVVEFKEHIEGYFIPNGQRIWSREISINTTLRKYGEESILLYDKSSGEITLLNSGGVKLDKPQLSNHQHGALDIASFNSSIISIAKDENGLSIQKDDKKYSVEISYEIDKEHISIELLDENIVSLLFKDENIYRVLTYQLESDKKWKIQDSLVINIENSHLSSLRRDDNGRVWYKSSQGQIAFLIQSLSHIQQSIDIIGNYYEYYIPKEPILLKIDSLEYNTRWHKILIEYRTPDETDIRIGVVADNNRDYKPKSESYLSIKNLSRDIFLPELQGQYLFVQIYLITDQTQQNSPTIDTIRFIYPRSTYLEYLPSHYEEDKQSALVLERFFSIFETISSRIEDKRASTPSLIDSQETSKANLAWLSSWMGLNYDESWDELKWRKLMREAPKLFDIRGTRKGIERVIEIYSDYTPLIEEPMQKRCHIVGVVDSYSFCVFLKPEQYQDIEEVKTIRGIVEEWKPAYTKALVVPLKNRILLGSHIFLGINTKLEKMGDKLGDAEIPFIRLASAKKDDSRTLERIRIGYDAILQ